MARNDSKPTETNRTRKSAAEKAQADYDRAARAVEKATESVEKYQFALDESVKRRDEAQRYLDFVRMNPALPPAVEDGGNVIEGITVTPEPAGEPASVNAL